MRPTHILANSLVLLLFATSWGHAQSWTVETVGQDVQYVDFAIDGAGTLHVLYADGSDPAALELIYAFDAGAGWQVQTVPAVLVPNSVGIAVDDGNVAHITFVDSTATVQYGFRSGNAWVIEPLPSVPIQEYPYDPSIALDTSGAPHIAYQTYGERIRYAHKEGGIWTDEEVDDSAVGLNNSRVCMAIDPAGGLHIAARQTFGGPALFTLGPSLWTHENFGVWGYQPWVVYGQDGFAHYIYWGDGTSYATNRSGFWDTEVLDADTTPEANGIALDENGLPALTYSHTFGLYYQPPDIHYETRIYFAFKIGAGWLREEIDHAPDYTGDYYVRSCVEFDADNVPHVLYRHPGTGELRHAVRNLPTTVDGPPRSAIFEDVSVLPNPFNPSAQIWFRMVDAASVRITIHDQAGRNVRALFDGPLGAGEHAKRWDGRDQRGLEVASGVYFVRFDTTNDRVTRKLLLVR